MPEKLAAHQMLDESMQRALQKVLKERPDVKPVSLSSAGDSLLAKFFQPKGAQATTNPWTGNITYNPDAMLGMPQAEIENTIAHELTHSKQSQDMSLWDKLKLVPAGVTRMLGMDEKVPEGIGKNSPINAPYFWRSDELEAFQTERDRTMKQNLPIYSDPMLGTRDIPLFPERKQGINTGPSKRTR